MLHIKLAQFAVLCALPPRRSESLVCANDNKPSCVLHLLGWFIGSRGFSSLERRPEFWVLHPRPFCSLLVPFWGLQALFCLEVFAFALPSGSHVFGSESYFGDWVVGWDGMGQGKEVQEGGDVCILIADSLHCAAETDTSL